MLCTKCNSDNPADASFCERCGSKPEVACPACKAPVSPGARFCKRCGTAIGAAKPDAHAAGAFFRSQIKVAGDSDSASEAIDGEYKTVTALFADVQGSMDLMEEIDPEEARRLVDPIASYKSGKAGGPSDLSSIAPTDFECPWLKGEVRRTAF